MIFLRYEEKKGYCSLKILSINSRTKLFFFLVIHMYKQHKILIASSVKLYFFYLFDMFLLFWKGNFGPFIHDWRNIYLIVVHVYIWITKSFIRKQ